MRTLNEFESNLVERNHTFTTFKQCSFDDEHHSFICSNETIRVFDLDEVKEAVSKGKYSTPMSMDALWIDHEQQTLHVVEFNLFQQKSPTSIGGEMNASFGNFSVGVQTPAEKS